MKQAVITLLFLFVVFEYARGDWFITSPDPSLHEGNRLGGSASAGNTVPCSTVSTAVFANGYSQVSAGETFQVSLNVSIPDTGGIASASLGSEFVASNITIASTDTGRNVTFSITFPGTLAGSTTIQFLFASTSNYYQCLDIMGPLTLNNPSTGKTSSSSSLVASTVIAASSVIAILL